MNKEEIFNELADCFTFKIVHVKLDKIIEHAKLDKIIDDLLLQIELSEQKRLKIIKLIKDNFSVDEFSTNISENLYNELLRILGDD